jgi:hypothetical protein
VHIVTSSLGETIFNLNQIAAVFSDMLETTRQIVALSNNGEEHAINLQRHYLVISSLNCLK